MKKTMLHIGVVMLATSTSLIAQESKEQRLSGFIDKTLKTLPIIPSVSIAVSNGEGSLFTKGFGKYDLENRLVADSKTNYYMASSTKSFVGLLAAISANEGTIDLNRKINTYKPFRDFSRNDVFRNITVLDLLTHQSGIDNNYLSFLLAYSGDYTKENILKLIEQETIKNENGNNFEYTNFGYYLFDFLLQEEFGLNWKDVLKEKVFEPLGMDNTTAYISQTPTMALPYNSVFPEKLKELHLKKTNATMHAAGGLVSNAHDMAKYLTFLINKGEVENRTIVSEKTLLSTYKKQVSAEHKGIKVFEGNGYGMGWRLGTFNDEAVLYHFGGYPGYYSHLSFLPERKLGVTVFINHELGLPVANLIANYAYDLYLGNESKLKRHEKVLKSKLPKLLKSAQKSQLAHEKKQGARTWQLSLSKKSYVGHFRNEKFGLVKIVLENGINYAEIGNLKAECTPFPELDTMRIELIPGSGTVIEFVVENNKAIAISYGGEQFKRVE